MGKLTFNAHAGLAVRGAVRRAVKEYAWSKGFEVEVEEDKGLLGSLFRFRLEVPDKEIDLVHQDLENYFRKFED